ELAGIVKRIPCFEAELVGHRGFDDGWTVGHSDRPCSWIYCRDFNSTNLISANLLYSLAISRFLRCWSIGNIINCSLHGCSILTRSASGGEPATRPSLRG